MKSTSVHPSVRYACSLLEHFHPIIFPGAKSLHPEVKRILFTDDMPAKSLRTLAESLEPAAAKILRIIADLVDSRKRIDVDQAIMGILGVQGVLPEFNCPRVWARFLKPEVGPWFSTNMDQIMGMPLLPGMLEYKDELDLWDCYTLYHVGIRYAVCGMPEALHMSSSMVVHPNTDIQICADVVSGHYREGIHCAKLIYLDALETHGRDVLKFARAGMRMALKFESVWVHDRPRESAEWADEELAKLDNR